MLKPTRRVDWLGGLERARLFRYLLPNFGGQYYRRSFLGIHFDVSGDPEDGSRLLV